MPKHTERAKLTWLYEELADLRAQGIIDEPTEQKIRAHYGPLDDSSARTARRYFSSVPTLLGVLLIGGGVVLLFAWNWDMLSAFQRLLAAFIPVVAGVSCGAYTLAKEKGALWREISAFLTAVGFAVLTALTSQIYHTGGTLYEFLKLILAVSLPLVYIFRSHMLAAIYCVAIFALSGHGGHGYADTNLLYPAGITPYILYYLFFHKPEGLRTVWMRYICLLPLAWLLMHFAGYGQTMPNFFATAALLFTAGLTCGETKRSAFGNPWLVCGWLLLTALLAFGSSSFLYGYPPYANPVGFWLIPFAAGGCLAARRPTPLKIVVMLTALLPFLPFLSRLNPQGMGMAWATTGCFLLIGAVALTEGIKEGSLLKLNAGLLQIALLAVMKFLDPQTGILYRATAFIATGVSFVGLNIYMNGRFRNEAALRRPEKPVEKGGERQC